MQNFLTARYRQVHEKIKDVRISDLANKFPKGIREARLLSFLDNLPPSPLMGKVSYLGEKITHLPYSNYWRKSWPLRYWALGVIVSLPVFYRFKSMTNARTSTESLEVVRRRTQEEIRRGSNGVSMERNIPQGSE